MTEDDPTCDADCTSVVCGDGYLNAIAGEQCDDGNGWDGDGCSSDCMVVACGNGVVESGEQCDPGIDPSACNPDCTHSVCGDDYVNFPTEWCDDGNTTAGDGCSPTCQQEYCGNNTVDPGEECDDGWGDRPTCDGDCTDVVCGDGRTNTAAGEECDDRNAIAGDGCSDTCKVEANCGLGEFSELTDSESYDVIHTVWNQSVTEYGFTHPEPLGLGWWGNWSGNGATCNVVMNRLHSLFMGNLRAYVVANNVTLTDRYDMQTRIAQGIVPGGHAYARLTDAGTAIEFGDPWRSPAYYVLAGIGSDPNGGYTASATQWGVGGGSRIHRDGAIDGQCAAMGLLNQSCSGPAAPANECGPAFTCQADAESATGFSCQHP